MIPVLIHGITNKTDALAAARLGVNELGFQILPDSPRYIELTLAKSIIDQLPNTVQIFLEADEYQFPYLQEITRKLHISSLLVPVQLYSKEFESLGCSLTLKGWADDILPRDSEFTGSTIVLDDMPLSQFLQPEGDMVQQWKALNQQHFLILPCDVVPEALSDALSTIQPAGLLLEGATESQPGLQEYPLIQRYLATLSRIITRV